MNQFKFDNASEIYVLHSAKQDDAGDLVALGTDHSVEIILIGERAVKVRHLPSLSIIR